jgi:hypothetical protein
VLIDDVLGDFDVTRVDTVVVRAPAEDVYRIARDIDLVEVVRADPLVGALFALRSIPDRIMRLLARAPAAPDVESMRLADLGDEGEWIRLAEEPGREFVFGSAGRFWNGPIQWDRITPASFSGARAAGTARIAANLAVHPYSRDRVLLTYEARTAAADDEARAGVQRYWRFLSPFIGVVLRSVLRAVKHRAEASAPRDADPAARRSAS